MKQWQAFALIILFVLSCSEKDSMFPGGTVIRKVYTNGHLTARYDYDENWLISEVNWYKEDGSIGLNSTYAYNGDTVLIDKIDNFGSSTIETSYKAYVLENNDIRIDQFGNFTIDQLSYGYLDSYTIYAFSDNCISSSNRYDSNNELITESIRTVLDNNCSFESSFVWPFEEIEPLNYRVYYDNKTFFERSANPLFLSRISRHNISASEILDDLGNVDKKHSVYSTFLYNSSGYPAVESRVMDYGNRKDIIQYEYE